MKTNKVVQFKVIRYSLKKSVKNILAYSITLSMLLILVQAGQIPSLHAMEIKTPPPVSGRAATLESILPADVLARARLVRDELEQIRFKMGKSDKQPSALQVQNAAPREVYFQAVTLFRKSNRLSFEQTGKMDFERKPVSPKHIRPFHVWTMVNESLKRVLHVKQILNISKKIQERGQVDLATPSDVFILLIQVNRTVDLMLDIRFSPKEVFREVTIGVRYASELLSAFPDSTRIVTEPSFEEGKRPRDVYQALLDAFTQVQNILHRSGEKGMVINTQSIRLDEVTASEVFDIASILVSELSYLHTKLFKTKHPPFEGYDPGRRFPSHVFQRVGILQTQLTELSRYVEKQPDWLNRK